MHMGSTSALAMALVAWACALLMVWSRLCRGCISLPTCWQACLTGSGCALLAALAGTAPEVEHFLNSSTPTIIGIVGYEVESLPPHCVACARH